VSIGKRIFGLALVGALCTSALIAILLFGEFDDTTARILATTGLIGLFSLVSLPGGVLLDQGRYAGLAWVVITLAAAGFLLAMTLVWGDEGDDTIWQLAGSVTAVAGASRRPRRRRHGAAKRMHPVSGCSTDSRLEQCFSWRR
jgi:hypothetical protein